MSASSRVVGYNKAIVLLGRYRKLKEALSQFDKLKADGLRPTETALRHTNKRLLIVPLLSVRALQRRTRVCPRDDLYICSRENPENPCCPLTSACVGHVQRPAQCLCQMRRQRSRCLAAS
eukprot:2477374-Pleurochrysis_carterae.AAC.3